MYIEEFINGLKTFFKEERLSDRRLRIAEIDESFGSNSRKRKHSEKGVFLSYFCRM